MYVFVASYAQVLNRFLDRRYWAIKLLPAADMKKGTDYSVVNSCLLQCVSSLSEQNAVCTLVSQALSALYNYQSLADTSSCSSFSCAGST